MLVTTAVIGGGLGLGAYLYLRASSPTWTSEARLEANFKDQFSPISDALRANADELDLFIAGQNRIDQIKQHSQQHAKPGMKYRPHSGFQEFSKDNPVPEQRTGAFGNLLSVSPIRGSTMIQLSLGTKKPVDAPEILTALINVYLAQWERNSQESTGRDFSELNASKSALLADLGRLDNRLEQTSRNQIPNSVTETTQWLERSQLIAQQTRIAEILQQTENAYAVIQQQLQDGTLQPTSNDELVVQNDPRVRQLDYEVDRLKRLLDSNRVRYGANHTVTRTTEHELDALLNRRTEVFDQTMQQVLQSNVMNAENARDSFTTQLADVSERVDALSSELADIDAQINQRQSLVDKIARGREKLQEIDTNLDMLQTASGRAARDNKSVSLLIPPQKAKMTSPRSLLAPVGVLLGFGLPYGFFMLRELLDQRVRSPLDLKAIPQAEPLGVIPDSKEDPSGNQSIERAVQNAPTGLLAESFRQSRTTILGKMDRRGYKSVVVCSGQGGAGASGLAQNLAASMALNGRKVLIIDTNFRRPRQHELFGVSNGIGLVSYLTGQQTDTQNLITKLDQIDLSVMTCGPVDQAAPELLDRPSFRQLLADLETQFDVIVIDAAPALLTSEASLLIKCVDAVVAIVRADKDHRGMVERLLNRLDGQRADLLGVVLNGVKASAGGYFKKNYEDFYRYNQGVEWAGEKVPGLSQNQHP